MHYAMSDIHGHYQKYKEMLKIINLQEEDTLYIIGDLIDRGEDSGSLLKEVMQDSRVVFLLGNHELLFLHALDSVQDMSLWIANGGEPTIEQLERAGIDYREASAYFSNLPVVIPNVAVNGRNFYLCHASPILRSKTDKEILYMKDLTETELMDVVWSRAFSHGDSVPQMREELKERFPDTLFLIGHTQTHRTDYCRKDAEGNSMISVTPDGLFVNLDCGCASHRRLGCMCLETLEEFYV